MKPRVAVIPPGSNFSHNFLVSWTNFYGHLLHKCDAVWVNFPTGTFLNDVRNMGVDGNKDLSGPDFKPWNGERDYTHILWIDSDMIYEPWMFDELMKYEHLGCVGAGYPKQDKSSMVCAVAGADGQPHGMISIPDKIAPVLFTGFGFLLMKRGLLEKIGYPWFNHEYLPTPWTAMGETQMGEDISFFHKLNQAGLRAYIEPKVTKAIQHEKMIGLTNKDVLRHNGLEG